MDLGQDPKYRTVDGAIVNRRSSEAIAADEPVFILRARDVHAREALDAYACILMPGEHRDAVCQRAADFARSCRPDEVARHRAGGELTTPRRHQFT